MKITKKQWIIGACIALVLASGSAGIVMNRQAHVQAEKREAQAKQVAHDKLVKEATEATKKAETFKAEADVKTAQEAIKKLDEKDQTDLVVRVELVRQNWDLVNKVEKKVSNAEKIQNDANVKTAQTAIDGLKAEMTKTKKAAFQKRLDKVKTALKNNKARAKAKAEKEAQIKAEQEAQTQAQAQNNVQAEVPRSESVPQVESTPDYGQVAPAPEAVAPAPSVPANNGGTTPAPTAPPAHNGGGNANPNVGANEIDQWTNNANNSHGNDGVVNGGW